MRGDEPGPGGDQTSDARVAEMTTPTNPDAIFNAIKVKNNDH